MSTEGTTGITAVRAVGVPVTDQDKALDFYTGTLGMEKRLDTPLPQFGGRWIEVGPPGAPTTIALVPAGEDHPAGVDTGIRLSTPDATALHAELSARGVTVHELLAWPGVPPMFSLRDQDGNRLYISSEPGDQS